MQTWFLPTAEAKALGVQDPTTPESDGILGVSSNFAYTFSQDGGSIAPGTFDLVGILYHEITHAMGRIDDSKDGLFTPFDAGAYNKMDALPQLLSGAPDRYFSIDGSTPLYGLDSTSDPADADGTNGLLPGNPGFATISDSFNAFLDPATLYPWSNLDSRTMDVLGFQVAGSQPPPQPPQDPASAATLAQPAPPGIMTVQDFPSLLPTPDLGPGPLGGGGSGGMDMPPDITLTPPALSGHDFG